MFHSLFAARYYGALWNTRRSFPSNRCCTNTLDQIRVTALSAHQTRIENLSLVLSLNRGEECFCYIGCRLPWSWGHAEL
jgi:hypothetical protein